MFECVYMFHEQAVPIGARRALAPLKLELQIVVSCRVGARNHPEHIPGFPQLLKRAVSAKWPRVSPGKHPPFEARISYVSA